jgi:membrane protein YqaA with SNARE-associated domain
MTQDRSDNADEVVASQRSRLGLIVRFLLGLGVLLGGVMLLVRTLRPELTAVGQWFVDHFGLFGVAAGAFIADGFHFPVPPQAYMLLATAAKSDPLTIVLATSAGSLLGGAAGYHVAWRLGHIRALAAWLERVSGKTGQLLGRRYPYRSAALASATPMAFSVLCYLAGLFRVGRGPLLLLLLLRIPKLALYYYLVRLGWSLS